MAMLVLVLGDGTASGKANDVDGISMTAQTEILPLNRKVYCVSLLHFYTIIKLAILLALYPLGRPQWGDSLSLSPSLTSWLPQYILPCPYPLDVH